MKAKKTILPVAIFKQRVKRWAGKIGVKPEKVYVQAMSNKWGSCSTGKRVYFSKDLLDQDIVFQDSVIAHELLHLAIPNHGALFKSLLQAHLSKKPKPFEKLKTGSNSFTERASLDR